MAGFLTGLNVEGFQCLRDVKCSALTPLHAFIGPNDSGKSTLLKLVESLVRGVRPEGIKAFASFKDGSGLWIDTQGRPGTTPVQVTVGGNAQLQVLSQDVQQQHPGALSVRVAIGQERAQLVRLSADELRQGSQLIPYGVPLVLEGRGRNIVGLYDALRDRSVDRFSAISKQVTEFFPTVRSLGLRAVGSTEKVLVVTLNDGTQVPASAMSEGLLYYLAFAILGELQRPAVYLVEEPENGLHPSRIADIVGLLRKVAEDPKNPVQVLLATHSPLVVNELRPEEVTVVTRDPVTGTQLRPIKDTPHFDERSKVYALGELWLSYADGKEEKPLFDQEGR